MDDHPTNANCGCQACRTAIAARLFERNPDHVAPPAMRRSIHRSHRREGFNDGVGE